jgi:hypothetical protein
MALSLPHYRSPTITSGLRLAGTGQLNKDYRILIAAHNGVLPEVSITLVIVPGEIARPFLPGK